jgi:DNA primase
VSVSTQKQKAIESLFPYIHILESDVARNDALLQTAVSFGADGEALSHDYAHWEEKQHFGASRSASSGGLAGGRVGGNTVERRTDAGAEAAQLANAEAFLLAVVVANADVNPDGVAELRRSVPLDSVEIQNARELYLALEEWLRSGEEGERGLYGFIKNEELSKLVLEKSAAGEFSVNPAQLVADSIMRVKRQKLVDKRRSLLTKMRTVKEGGSELEELLEEKKYIDKVLNSLILNEAISKC